MIRFNCSECDQPLHVPQEMAGQKGECPICNKRITVPLQSTRKSEDDNDVPPPDSPPPVPATPTNIHSSFSGDDVGEKCICPHCWHVFGLSQILFITRHQELVGDSVLGPEAPKRFLPSRFTPEGHALDSMGFPCSEIACPRCHLIIPPSMTEVAPMFLSVIGVPASGKSYFLTSMTWELRNILTKHFALSFGDADTVSNQSLNEYEQTLFLSPDPDSPVAIRKTELQGELYDEVNIQGQIITLPRPFTFDMRPMEHHPHYQHKEKELSRVITIYDNAGEHFQPGMDSVATPTTQHLTRAEALFFLFDPTKDPRFRSRCKSDDPQLKKTAKAERQEILLQEAIRRIRQYTGLRQGQSYKKPLIIVIGKFDIWKDLVFKTELPNPVATIPNQATSALNTGLIESVSFAIRHLLDSICPEFISVAESFSDYVRYIPVSALGSSPEEFTGGKLVSYPKNIKPIWAAVPFLYMLSLKGFIPKVVYKSPSEINEAEIIKATNSKAFIKIPSWNDQIVIPKSYLGMTLRCPKTSKFFRIPKG